MRKSSAKKAKQKRLILLSNYAFCGIKKKKKIFTKNKQLHNFDNIWNNYFKINKIINKFIFTGDKYMPELHLKRPGSTYSAFRQFTKHRERIQKLRENKNNLFRKEFDKACFAHNAAYSDTKDLDRRTASDMILKKEDYEIARNWKHYGCQRALTSMVYKFFDKKTGLRVSINKQPAEEFHKPVIKEFKGRKVNARFKENTWTTDFVTVF